jgi:hypothetical protein
MAIHSHGGTKMGTLTPVIYFLCSAGHVVLAPYSSVTISSCEYQHPVTSLRCGLPVHREGADTLTAIGQLERRLTAQENAKFAVEKAIDESTREEAVRRTRDNLCQKLYSSATPQAEKDFIRAWMDLQDEKRAKHASKYEAYSVYVHAAHYDSHGRQPDDERNPG